MIASFSLFVACLLSLTLPIPTRADTPQGVTGPAVLRDDLNYRDLHTALEKSSRFYQTRPNEIFTLCGHRVSAGELARAYQAILAKLHSTDSADIDHFITENFTLCRPTPLLVTGYYSPILAGSLTPSEQYRHPLYGLPQDEEQRRASRAAINNKRLLQGQEIAYLADPLDVFFLHVQGSGVLCLENGEQRLVHYAGNNDRPYTSIGKVLIDEGKLAREEVTMATIRQYLNTHPLETEEILHRNERFIFFKLAATIPPESAPPLPSGSLGHTLTAGRSVAMDDRHYPPGILGMLTSRLPHFAADGTHSWLPLQRLVTHQDSGGAITGPHRLDLFLGSGPEAGAAAGLMKEKGSFAILIPSLSLRAVHSKIDRSTSPHSPAPQTAR